MRRLFSPLLLGVFAFTSGAMAQERPAPFDPADFGQIVIQPRQSTGADGFVLEQAFGNYQNEPIFKYGERSPAVRLGQPVGRLDMLFEDGSTGFCTGFLVDDRHVLTNHHCVPGMDGDASGEDSGLQAAQLVMGYIKPGVTDGVDRYTVSPRIVETNRDLDYSVLQVFGDPAARYGTLELADADPEDGEFLWIIGHPQGQSQHISREGCGASTPAISGEGKLMHTCDTLAGNSGSPVIRLSDKRVVGLHHAGDSRSGYNMAIPMTRILAASRVLRGAEGAPRAVAARPSPMLGGQQCGALWAEAKGLGCAGYEAFLDSCNSHAFAGLARRFVERECTASAAPSATTAPESHSARITVRPDGGDFASLAEAVSAAPEGARIEVHPGVYTRGLDVHRAVEIVAVGPRHAVRLEVSGENAIRWSARDGRIAGLSIHQTGGRAFAVSVVSGRLRLEDSDIRSAGLANIAVQSGEAHLRRNTIRDGAEGGVYVSKAGILYMEDNEVSGNRFAGLEVKDKGQATVRGNVFRDGQGSGILIAEGATARIEGNTLYGNALAAIEVWGAHDAQIIDNVLRDGAQGGILVAGKTTARIEGNRITGHALSGLEVRNEATPEAIGNEIAEGRQSGVYIHARGGGVFRDNEVHHNAYFGVSVKGHSAPILRGNVIHSNGHAAIRIREGAAGVYENNELAGNPGGGFDISEDAGKVLRRGNGE